MKLLREYNPNNFSTWVLFEDDRTQFFTLNLELLQYIKYDVLIRYITESKNWPCFEHESCFTNEEVVNEIVAIFRNDTTLWAPEREAFLQEQLTTIVNELFPETNE